MKKLRDYNFVVFGSTGWIGKNFINRLSSEDCEIFLYSHKKPKELIINNSTYESRPIQEALDLNLQNVVLIDLAFPTKEKIKNLGDEEYINQIIDLEKIKKDFLIKNEVSDVFLSSSGAIYKGDNLYAIHKKKQEEFYIKSSKQQNFSLFIGRIFASIGPYYNKEENYAFSSFMNSALNGDTIHIKSPSNVERSYIYIPNLIEFVLDSILQTDENRTQIFDAVQINYEIRELAKIIAKTYNVKIKDNSKFSKNNEADIYVSEDTTLINYLDKKNLGVSITKNEILSSQLN